MYKITIEKIVTEEYPEKEIKYIDPKTGENCSYPYNGCDKVSYETGKMLRREDRDEMYVQVVENLDINEVIKAINAI